MNKKGLEYSKNGAELRKIQKELVDTILTKPDELEKITNVKLAALKGFHQYTLNNILLASWELYARTGRTVECLAPYSKWNNLKDADGNRIDRHVKKGETALRIIAPWTFKYETLNEDGEKVEKTEIRFKSVPVFDVSQTEGEPLTKFFAKSEYDYSLDEITSRGKVKVNFSEGEFRRGFTDGKEIWISEKIPVERQICTYFHELAHCYLHFKDGESIERETKELEAEAVSYLVSCFIGIKDKSSPAYIVEWTGKYDEEKRAELLKGKGSNVLKTAEKIIGDLKLAELLECKTTIPTTTQSTLEVKA